MSTCINFYYLYYTVKFKLNCRAHRNYVTPEILCLYLENLSTVGCKVETHEEVHVHLSGCINAGSLIVK